MNPEEKRKRQLQHLKHQRRVMHARLERHVQQLERRRVQLEERFIRARQRLGDEELEPNDDQQRIIAAALELLNETGLNSLSLRKLAAKLDLKAPALYWYFKNKEVLIDYMAEAILREAFVEITPRCGDEPWQDWLVEVCQRLRRAMLAYRDGARVVAGAHLYPAVTLMRIFEVSMVSLTSAGLDIRQANLVISTAVHFVFGNVIEQQAAPSLEQIQHFDAYITTVATEYPMMADSIRQTLEMIESGYDEFEDSLRLIIGHASC